MRVLIVGLFLSVLSFFCACGSGSGSRPIFAADGDSVDGDLLDDDTRDDAQDETLDDERDDVQDGDAGDVQDVEDSDNDVSDSDVADGDGEMPADGDAADAPESDGDLESDAADGDSGEVPEEDGDILDQVETEPDAEEEIQEVEARVTGSITLWEASNYANGTVTTTAGALAYFQNVQPQTFAEPISVGDCRVYVYDPDQPPAVSFGLSAGVITVTGAQTDPIVLTPDYDDDYGYTYSSNLAYDLSGLFDGGENLEATAAGAEVSAFELQAVAGVPISGLSPNFLVPAYTYDPGDPLSFSWTAVGASSMFFTLYAYLYQGSTLSEGATITCSTDDDGSFAFPAQALDMLPAGAQIHGMSLGRSSWTEARLGDVRTYFGTQVSKARSWSSF